MIEAVITTRDGLERCTRTTQGRAEYVRRRYVKWLEQGERCALCKMKMRFEEATTDHIIPRGMGAGSRNDALSNIQAVHYFCNAAKGSRRLA